jgi:hypothetical protein
MQMKKIFFSFWLLLASFWLFTPKAFAHILVTDRNIGAVLHIDPEDDPIVKQQAGFFFEFKDRDNKFKPQNCDCTFKVLQANKEIYSTPLFGNNDKPSLDNASVFYTFPEKNVYKIQVIGKPTDNSFTPFTLSYDIRVEREAGQSTSSSQNWFVSHILHFIVGGIIVMFIIISFSGKKKKV